MTARGSAPGPFLRRIPPAPSLALGTITLHGRVQWPPHERGRPLYEERPRRLLGIFPWGTGLVPLLT